MPTTRTHTRTDTGLAAELRISVMRLARRLRLQRADPSLSDTQLAALGAIERNGSMTPGELAEHEKVQPPSMTRVISALEENGLIARTSHPTDRRQVLLALTEKGSALLGEIRRRRTAWLARRLRELTPEERATLRAAVPILEKLSRAGGEANKTSS
ncbi:MAG: MarR family transcriptional regulator [Streptosporangiales bacterium]|nr:MarR family transcriptional regulator [Streptosporangiales bacterium]